MSHSDLQERIEFFVLRVVRFVGGLPSEELFRDLKAGLLQSATAMGTGILASSRIVIREEYERRLLKVIESLEESVYWLNLVRAARIVDPKMIDLLKEEARDIWLDLERARTTEPETPQAATKKTEAPPPEVEDGSAGELSETPKEVVAEETSDKLKEELAWLADSIVNVLLIRGDTDDSGPLQQLLQNTSGHFTVTLAKSLEEGIESLHGNGIDVVLLDPVLPDSEGIEAIPRIRQVDSTVPIVLLLNPDEEELAEQGLKHGAQDYFVKSRRDGNLLIRSIRYAMRLKQSEYLARHDSLTGLPNRTFLEERLKAAIAQSRRSRNSTALLFLDLDNFKEINDQLGHEIGDRVLQAMAERLSYSVRETDTVARLGGDEFVIVLTNLEGPQDVTKVAEKILEEVTRPHRVNGGTIQLQTSIGISTYPEDGEDIEVLLRQADSAMYESKEEGGNQFHFSNAELDEQVFQQRALRSELYQALEKGELVLYYQPQMVLGNRAVSAVEALLRWDHPEKGLLLPGQFLPRPLDTRFLLHLLEWTLEELACQKDAWQGIGEPLLPISINLHNHRLNPRQLLEAVLQKFEGTDLQAQRLALELTEESLRHSFEANRDLLLLLAEAGIGLILDDFGHGDFSLSRLGRLPVSSLKLNRALVREMMRDPEQARLVQTLISLGHNLKLKMVAKGVEESEQVALLHKLRCDEIQGYYFAHPMPLDSLLHFMERVKAYRA